jgi:cell division protein FtsQ
MHPHRRIWLWIAPAVFIAIVALWALTYSPLFAAKHVRVEGNRRLNTQAIRARSGITQDTNVFHLDIEAIEARLLEDPWVASASVGRDLPNTVVLAIVERRAVGRIASLGDTSVLADDGTELPVTDVDLTALPIVRAGLGAPSDAQRQAAAAMLTVLETAPSMDVRDVLVSQDGIVTIHLKDGTPVVTGVAGDEAAKAEALRALLRLGEQQDVTFTSIDVSSPAAPSATLPGGSTFGL